MPQSCSWALLNTSGTTDMRCSLVSWLLPQLFPHNICATSAEAFPGALCHRGENLRKTIRSALQPSKCLKPCPGPGAHVGSCWLVIPALEWSVCEDAAPSPPSSEPPQRPGGVHEGVDLELLVKAGLMTSKVGVNVGFLYHLGDTWVVRPL